jgi:SOS response regulatory protein OraA/RecX
MSDDTPVTTPGDAAETGLAPVTDLFGARSRRRAAAAAAGADPEAGGGSGTPGGTAEPEAPATSEWRPPVTGIARGYGETADANRASVFSITSGAELDAVKDDGVDDRSGADDGSDADDGSGADETPTRSPDEQAADAERLSMRTLGRRGVSVAELWTVLVEHDLDEPVVAHEIERLTGVGLLDDTALAAELIDRLRTRKGLGRQGIVAELRRRKLAAQSIEIALEASVGGDADDETARALDLAMKRAGQMRGLDRDTAERRLTGFLMRKGYGSSAVRNAVRRALDANAPRGGVRFE